MLTPGRLGLNPDSTLSHYAAYSAPWLGREQIFFSGSPSEQDQHIRPLGPAWSWGGEEDMEQL